MFLKNKNIIFKIRRSKVTDYAALNVYKSPGSVQYIWSKSYVVVLIRIHETMLFLEDLNVIIRVLKH